MEQLNMDVVRNSAWWLVTYQLMQVGFIVDSLFPSEQLQKDNAKAVDIRFLIQPWRPGVLWIDVADGS